MGTESCSSRTAIPRFRKDWQSPRSISRVVLSSRAAKLFGTHRINCTAPTKHPGLSVCCCSEGKPAPFLSSSCSPARATSSTFTASASFSADGQTRDPPRAGPGPASAALRTGELGSDAGGSGAAAPERREPLASPGLGHREGRGEGIPRAAAQDQGKSSRLFP